MQSGDAAEYHRLYGTHKPRIAYARKDFVDYALMTGASAAVIAASYGTARAIAMAGTALCAFALCAFAVRHGVELTVPLLARRPQDALYAAIHKLQNLRGMYLAGVAVLLLEQAAIRATPGLPHHVELMRTIALGLFYLHLASITLFRTVILADHLRKRALVREVLRQTPWKRVITPGTNITFEILHAYCTGLLAHVLLIAPWYVVLTHARFSLVFLPAVCAIDLAVHAAWLRAYNGWFYRDHWLGHNSEFEFLYLHGAHHDAIPSALIAVADSGFLEGFVRFATASPVAFYEPVVAFLIYMFDVKSDIEMHQYIPGIYPRLSRRMLEVFQHSTHHYGRLEPYGLAMKVDQPGIPDGYRKRFARFPDSMKNSFRLDEELSGLRWDNTTHRRTLALWDRYQPRRAAAPAPHDEVAEGAGS
jgi:hypothetical protein